MWLLVSYGQMKVEESYCWGVRVFGRLVHDSESVKLRIMVLRVINGWLEIYKRL